MSEQYKLSYFNIKGLAEPIRIMFAAAKVDYEDNRIAREDWPLCKKNFEFEQLPVLEIGDKKLSQSNSICRYLAKKLNLNGKDEWEDAKLDELADVLVDFRTEWRKYFMEKDPEKKEEFKKAMLENAVPKYLNKIEVQKKASGGRFLLGDKLTWVDIQFAHFFELFEVTVGVEMMERFPNLKELQIAVFKVPEIQNWIEKRPKTEF